MSYGGHSVAQTSLSRSTNSSMILASYVCSVFFVRGLRASSVVACSTRKKDVNKYQDFEEVSSDESDYMPTPAKLDREFSCTTYNREDDF